MSFFRAKEWKIVWKPGSIHVKCAIFGQNHAKCFIFGALFQDSMPWNAVRASKFRTFGPKMIVSGRKSNVFGPKIGHFGPKTKRFGRKLDVWTKFLDVLVWEIENFGQDFRQYGLKDTLSKIFQEFFKGKFQLITWIYPGFCECMRISMTVLYGHDIFSSGFKPSNLSYDCMCV